MKKSFWLLDLVLIALGAWLLAGLIDTYAAHTLWPVPAVDDSSPVRPPITPRTQEDRGLEVIKQKNLFESALAEPKEPGCEDSLAQGPALLGRPTKELHSGFEFPDHYVRSRLRGAECRDWSSRHRPLKCEPIRDASIYKLEIGGLERPEIALFSCRPARFSWQESNLICTIAEEGLTTRWTHLWQQDGDQRQILAQAGPNPDDGTCTWLREGYVP